MIETGLVVLAAGMGTRMKSNTPKVLHKIANRTLLGHVLQTGRLLNPSRVAVVVGPDMPDVANEASKHTPDCIVVEQRERKGTAHAVSIAAEPFKQFKGVVVILYGDCPLVRAGSLSALTEHVNGGADAVVLAFRAANPKGYGRILRDASGNVRAIREELDATPAEREIDLCNSGIIAIKAETLWKNLTGIRNDNAKGEFYLTDIVELIVAQDGRVAVSVCDESEVAGVNDRVQLAELEARFQQQRRKTAMMEGATLQDPDSVYFSADTKLGRDIIIEPHVYFGPGVEIEDGVHIGAFSHIEGAHVSDQARLGPFARLRPGADIAASCHIGNFVEIKNARIAQGAKINHLSYVGDADVGAKSNIGAGTITCNYDGYEKHRTVIGAEVFVGSNSALVAPIVVGDGADIAAGSVITQNVPADALAIARGEQSTREGWAKRYRDIKKARKSAKQK